MSGTENLHESLRLTGGLQVVLARGGGGGNLKGFTMSGEDPPEHLTNATDFVVGGLRWFPKGEFNLLNIKELNKKNQG